MAFQLFQGSKIQKIKRSVELFYNGIIGKEKIIKARHNWKI